MRELSRAHKLTEGYTRRENYIGSQSTLSHRGPSASPRRKRASVRGDTVPPGVLR